MSSRPVSGRPAPRRATVGLRLGASATAGAIGGVVAAVASGSVPVGLVGGWLVFASLFLLEVWIRVGRSSADSTRRHATRQDPSVVASHTVTLVASVASLGSAALLQLAGGRHGAALATALLATVSVVASWALVHTVFMLRYAAIYYGGDGGGVEFNQREAPSYHDFAYLAFTVGMTYQVADTNITRPLMRSTVLRHALLSFLFGAVVIASVINVLVQLA